MKVLVVEDEARLAALLARGLIEAGHEVTVCHDGPGGLAAATTDVFDAVLLDWMLPGLDGPQVVSRLRAAGDMTPVLMLTARQDVIDRIAGLDAGADDYLQKPFVFDELLARLRALGRRGAAAETAELRVGDLRVDVERREVTRAGVRVELTAREFDILALLARRAGRCVTRYQILEEVWDGETDLRSNVIDVYIATLRAKIDKPFGRASIETLRGAGYRLSEGAG
ncbi:MAG TPA: response regulator transcription factor [Sporichthya sp.]|nr:response regulator transcription factor [Sporichthya sp.]